MDRTEKNPKYFYDVKDFPFLNKLVGNFNVIKDELIELLRLESKSEWLITFPDYVEAKKDVSWRVFTFVFFQMKNLHNADLCPRTAKFIHDIDEMISCDFSWLPGKTHILPHKGYTRMVLRCHLPLIVPDGELCRIRVGDEVRKWKEGELIIFDDSFEHEAWNDSKQDRVVLMFDIPNPNWNYTPNEISKFKIENMDDPFLLSFATKEQWQLAYQNKILPNAN
ncbi:MAG: aspartyl/asparaginyl beta-hydroxylase domain-containing protein [Crocinitomicaceae bacterium]|jgi:beta-hydroxylase|nr:aspartyl/asparaginyl beta-hydroxylase domain-containing protein [Crocinitomicaceae bacterium]